MGVVRTALLISACLTATMAASLDSAQGAGNTWAGTWSSDFGQMTLDASGSGSYAGFNPGTVAGHVAGNIDQGTWYQPGEPSKQGTFTFTLGADGRSFTGEWAYSSGGCGIACGWNGTCIAGPCLQNGTVSVVPGGAAPGGPIDCGAGTARARSASAAPPTPCQARYGTDLSFTSPPPGGTLQTTSPPVSGGARSLTVTEHLEGAAPTPVRALTVEQVREGDHLLWFCVFWGLTGIVKNTHGELQGEAGGKNYSLLVFIACLKLLGSEASAGRVNTAAGGCHATFVPVVPPATPAGRRRRLLADARRALRGTCTSDASGRLSLSLTATGRHATIGSLVGRRMRLGLLRARTPESDGPSPRLVLHWSH